MWQLTILKIFAIIVLTSEPLWARKHWKRAPVRGTFNVDVYAYNKPVVNLVGQQPNHNDNGVVLPMGQLLEQLSHSSRRAMSMQKSNYRNLDTDNYMARNQGVATDAADATLAADQIIAQQKQSTENLGANNLAINRQLAELQMNFALRNLYSHEFHVQNMGKRKIVQLNTLKTSHNASEDSGQSESKPESAEIMSEPLNLKLALPALPEKEGEEHTEEEEESEETTTSKVMENWGTLELPLKADSTEAISTFQQMDGNLETTTEVKPSQQLTDDSKHGPKHITTIEAPNTANAYDTEMEVEEMERKEQKQNAANDAKKNDSRHDNDGQVSGMPQSVAAPASAPAPIAADKPLTMPKSKRKKIKTKTKQPNEIDTKPTSASTSSLMMIGTADVKAPEITHTLMLNKKMAKDQKKQKGKGKGKGKEKVKSKRKGSLQEQEIETTTNWWHILPYAEIRKFLNTIYDSITDEDVDERRQRI